MTERPYASAHYFPVRHHSPRTSHVLRRVLDRVHPALVLVEGPEDATPLVASLVDPETIPPIAILGYRTDGTPGSSLWPFASYSPELVALKWASEHGVEARFIDLSTGQSLAADRHNEEPEEESLEAEEATPETPGARRHSFYVELAESRGFRSFEEFWEASFEAPDYDETSFREALLAYADVVRHEGRDVDFHRARDAFMARRVDAAALAGTPPERIVCVLGAAHAAALVARDVDDALADRFAKSIATAITIIPFSFPRLAEQTGYGAGNRAPQFYQRAWDAGLSFRRAALEVLIDFCDHLRLRGFMASLADTIEAYRLACTLADIRGKGEPGLDEIREATIATMCRGDASHVDTFLWPSVVGKNVGKVASRVGKNSLQAEFWREIEARRLPRTDAGEDFVLKLSDPFQVETSIFLHRLRVASIPYASFVGTAGTGRRARELEDAGGHAALSRVKEAWYAQWTPATDVSLVEKIVYGETLQGVCQRLLTARLLEASTTSAAAEVLLESVVAGAPETISPALAACDRLASTDDDLPSLAAACRSLAGLVAYGSSRSSANVGAASLVPLFAKTFDRAVLRMPDACNGNDEAVERIKPALRTLHDVAVTQPAVDRAMYIAAAHRLARDWTVHPSCAGVAAGLLYLAQELSEAEVGLVVEQRVSDRSEPEKAAAFLAGFLEVNALVLVKSRPVVAALDAFLVGIDKERFKDAVPVLRRAFAGLGSTERRYLVENIVALRKIGESAKDAARVIEERDKEKLASMSEDIAKAMEDLDDLL